MGKGAPLEREEVRRARLLVGIAATALLAPLEASGHGAEFLSAKLTVLPGAEVLLEITADCTGNPMIADEATAREVLADPIRLRRGEALVPLGEIATARVTRHDRWAEYAPVSYLSAEAGAAPHDLVTAAWRWRSREAEITFEMPRGKMHDVLLWTLDESRPGTPAKWMLLCGGDRSRTIAMTPARGVRSWMIAGAGGLLLGVVVWLRRGRVA